MMIGVLVMTTMGSRPDQGTVLQGGRTGDKSDEFPDWVGIVGAVGKETVVADRDPHSRKDPQSDGGGRQCPVVTIKVNISRNCQGCQNRTQAEE